MVTQLPRDRRPSLVDPELGPVWDAVRGRLERRGTDDRGKIRLPSLSSRARFLLGAMLGRPFAATLDLGALEDALVALGVAGSLPAALDLLGHPVSGEAAARRARRIKARAARVAVVEEASAWPEDWAPAWADDVARSGLLAGLDAGSARALARQVRMVLDHLAGAGAAGAGAGADGTAGGGGGGGDGAEPGACSRTELAATVLGSAHALDRGTRAAAAVTRALTFRHPGSDKKGVWALAGVQPDLVSATVLCWNLRPADGTGLETILTEASRLGVPFHLTQFALRRHPVRLAPGSGVLAVENPRVVEAAAEARSPLSVVALNGNASAAATLLVGQLLASGTRVRYHGDFDAPGLAICGRMHTLGLVPWHMDMQDYLRAVDFADRSGTRLPTESRPVPVTPWSPALREAVRRRRRIVHEELLLDELLQSES